LYNNSDTEVNLVGYKLTDDLAALTKWEFPAVTLGPRRYLVIFASDKDRRLPNSQLHTNFKLERQGELLALITHDGSTVVAAFSPQYPRQVSDVSWGLATDSEFTRAVDSATAVRVHVPADAALGLDWIASGFDDSAWREGTFGVGFERSPTSARSFTPMIGTDVEETMYRVNTSVYIRSTFSVADSSASDSMLLGMQYDDGFVLFLNGERILDANAPPVASLGWDSDASSSNPDTRAIEFEEFDLSEHISLLRDGVNVLAIQGLNVSMSSNDFLVNPVLELIDLGPVNAEVRQYFIEPTPGGPNREGADSVSPDPTFSHDSGAYGGNLAVELATEGEGAVIRYTLDGTIPDENAEVYAAPVASPAAATLTARVWAEGSLPGEAVSRSYLMLADSIQQFTSNLPIVLIDTFGRGIGEGTYTQVFCQFIDVGEDGRASITGEPDYVGRAGMKLRGSSSTGFAKKQYAFETWDEANEDLDVSVLGLPSESDWILHAPYSDKSLMRNVLSYEWSNHIGRYAVRTKFVEVYMNTRRNSRIGSSPAEYLGVYVFMEKIKRDGDRVDIDRLLPGDESAPEVTVGYFLQNDRLDPGDTGFTTSRGQRLAYFYPKERLIRPAQRTYIRNFMNTFEAALYGGNFRDPENGYAAHIDVMSFIDHHIMVELTKNIDGYRLSTFMYKPRGGKLTMGPIWDYNLSLGNANYLNGGNPVGWYYPQLNANDYPWYARLFQDTAGFRALYNERWRQLRGEQLPLAYLMGTVEEHAAVLGESQVRNFQRWTILGTYVWPNFYIAPSRDAEMTWMSGWLEDRVAWMDGQLLGLPSSPQFSSEGGFIAPGFQLEITSADDGA
ncbi:MAG: CotH kinase family protein, partial [Planctomycetes bacterium]|nr:CotH kinase family protein [Planctomycetota bacterium]